MIGIQSSSMHAEARRNNSANPIAIGIVYVGGQEAYSEIRDFALTIEALGVERLWVEDNVFGPTEWGNTMSVPEVWTMLAALAEATSTIRIGPLVNAARRRHPGLLAKIISTVDHISDGRLELGLGAGDEPESYRSLGMTFGKPSELIDAFREEIEILEGLWQEDRFTFKGNHYNLSAAYCNPKPVQQPHPPIWLGILEGKCLMPRLAAKHADWANIYLGDDAMAADIQAALDFYCKEIDRAPTSLRRSRCVMLKMDETHAGLLAHQRDKAKAIGIDENEYLDFLHKYERYLLGTPRQCASEVEKLIDQGFEDIAIYGIESNEELQYFADNFLCQIR